MRALSERVLTVLNGAVVALTHCPMGARVVRWVRWFFGLFSPVAVLVWCIGLGFGLSIGVVLVAIIDGRPPVVVTEFRETDGMVVQGGRINLLIEVDKHRDCPTQTARYLWRWVDDPDWPGQHVRLYVPIVGPPVSLSPVGEAQRSILSLSLSSDIAPGEGWFYESKSVRSCARFPVFNGLAVTQTRPIPIKVMTAEEAGDRAPQEGTVRRLDMRP